MEINNLIGKEVRGFKIFYAKYEEDTGNVILRIEFLDDNNKISRFTISYQDKYGFNYNVNGMLNPFDEQAFANTISDYALHNYNVNDSFAESDEKKTKESMFRVITDFLLMDDSQKISNFGYAITENTMTSLWLAILKQYSSSDFDEIEFNKQLVKRIDNLMLNYLKENPEYMQKLNMLNSNLNDLVRNDSVEHQQNSEAQQKQ